MCSEFAQSKRDAAIAADAHRVALNNLQKEKEDAERQRDDLRMRFGGLWPAPMLAPSGAAGGSGIGLSHTHTLVASGGLAAAESGAGHAPPSISLGQVDTSAGIRSIQAQLAKVQRSSS